MNQPLILSSPKYRPDIDGLRAIAVLAVVIFHAFPNWLPGGFIGVDIFFVISGYLISTIIFENLHNGTFSFKIFYARRVKRIFPTLILVLATSYAFGWFALLADEYRQLGKHIAGGAGFVSNFLLLNETGYFDNAAETKPLLHLWSLGVEEQFYIFFPLLIWFTWKSKVNILLVIVIIATISFFLNYFIITNYSIASYYISLTRFWEFLCGSFLAWFFLDGRKYFYLSKKLSIFFEMKSYATYRILFLNLISFFAIIILLWGFLKINKELNFPGVWTVIPVVGSFLIILAGPEVIINRKFLSNSVIVWFGLISFPLYLWHWPLLSFARIIESESLNLGTRLVLVISSIILAWITYEIAEKPIRLDGFIKTKVVILTIVMFMIGYAGYSIYMNNGYEFRSSIVNYLNNKNELLRTPAIDEACLKYIKNDKPLFPYCRYSDFKSNETIAVFGDSHAHVSFPGIADQAGKNGKNVVLLANSGCLPLLGMPAGDSEVSKKDCESRIEQLFNILKSKKDIKKVFIFTRGTAYVTNTEPLTGNKKLGSNATISFADFGFGLQSTINELSLNGKQVFYVTENPELSYTAESCMVRPMRISFRDCRPDKAQTLVRQSDYLKIIRGLKNVIILNNIELFCPSKKCSVFNQSKLLYADDDHLSIAGSYFQVEKLLKDYLN